LRVGKGAAVISDRIERSVVVSASPEQVWEALTTEDGMQAWFGDIAEMDVQPGGEAVFGWSEEGHRVAAVIETVEPITRFAFRWAINAGEAVEDGPSTLVEFVIDSDDSGTRITVVETGFASLPGDVAQHHFDENTSGWKFEMDELVDYLGAAAA
jgi:uncharacterized protein YndB with AHSA1/START domain